MNQWDDLAQNFNTHTANIDPDAADNIQIAWPALIRGIAKQQKKRIGLTALDFGCGVGSFCAELSDLGYAVTGYDPSEKMIEIAKEHIVDVNFLTGEQLPQAITKEYFDLISAVMVFQFIESLVETFALLSQMLMKKPFGLLAFAVFNPDYVKANHGEGKLFQEFENPEQPTRGYMCPKAGLKIPLFIRTENEYDSLLTTLGFTRIHTEKPPFAPEFLKKYPKSTDTQQPEYLVIVYQKSK